MTVKEALEQLRYEIEEEGHCSYIEDEMMVAFKCMEKQIPKKADTKITNRGINVSGEYDIDSDYICPICKSIVGDCETEDHWFDYCPNCGQALDWSDV